MSRLGWSPGQRRAELRRVQWCSEPSTTSCPEPTVATHVWDGWGSVCWAGGQRCSGMAPGRDREIQTGEGQRPRREGETERDAERGETQQGRRKLRECNSNWQIWGRVRCYALHHSCNFLF